MWFSRTFHKKLSQCSPDFIEQLKKLTFGYGGMMLRWIEKNNPNTMAIYIYDENKKVAAWVCIIPNMDYGANIGFYTDPQYRRRGLGLRLAKYISKYHNKLSEQKIVYSPHDFTSGEFFDKCAAKNYLQDTNNKSGI